MILANWSEAASRQDSRTRTREAFRRRRSRSDQPLAIFPIAGHSEQRSDVRLLSSQASSRAERENSSWRIRCRCNMSSRGRSPQFGHRWRSAKCRRAFVSISIRCTPPRRREQSRSTDRNICLSRAPPNLAEIEFGVGAKAPFAPVGRVEYRQVPGGDVATTTHWGDYSLLGPAHQAVVDWCKAEGHALAGVSWEVYGHWSDDPSKRRTDITSCFAPRTRGVTRRLSIACRGSARDSRLDGAPRRRRRRTSEAVL